MTTTDADGRFIAATLRPGKRRLYVYMDGLAPHFSNFELAEGERREVDVQLLPGATLVCTVRGPQGKPLNGAAVSVAGLTFPQQAVQMSHGGKPMRFSGMPPGTRKVSVYKESFARFEREVVFPATGELVLDVELGAGHAVKDRLLDDQGKPLAKRSVELGHGRSRVMTDKEGRFTLPDAAETGNKIHVRPSMGNEPYRLRVEGSPRTKANARSSSLPTPRRVRACAADVSGSTACRSAASRSGCGRSTCRSRGPAP
ncbi:MAG TPA: carboxypeptidase-like regulatory domain-containing protein [Planctomycetota bacterium]|nr:carboxypeptidase-like regulatory domain-containing protein [Planctomycetota bacterium]